MEEISKDHVVIICAVYLAGEWVRPSSLGVWLPLSPDSYFLDLFSLGLLDRRMHTSNSRFLRNNNKSSVEYRLSEKGRLFAESVINDR